jgi:hypothetical protein
MFFKTKKAILIGMASFFIFSTQAFAQKKKNGETYKDLISKAHNLVLQKDRQQAQLILAGAIKTEKPNSKAYKEIKKALSEVSQIFLSDKAQQLYELSLSLKRTDMGQAQQKLAEALRVEPDNVTLLAESARQGLIKGDCATAEDIISKAQKLNPVEDELILAQAQAQICSNDLGAFQKTRDIATTINFPAEWAILDIEKYVKDKNFSKAKESLAILKKHEKTYPEINYWLWKIENEQKINNFDAAQKYIIDCRNLSVHAARRFNLDPWLCRRVAETETFLKSQAQSQ